MYKDIFDATEKLTGVLFLRIANLLRRRGWAAGEDLRIVTHPVGGTVGLTITTVRLPGGIVGRFAPREQPDPDNKGWTVEIQRADGVQRQTWTDGLSVAAGPDGRFQFFYRNAVLSDDAILGICDELTVPGPSGLAREIHQYWSKRFGPIPVMVSEKVQLSEDLETLDQFLATILSAADVEEAYRKFNELFPLKAQPKKTATPG